MLGAILQKDREIAVLFGKGFYLFGYKQKPLCGFSQIHTFNCIAKSSRILSCAIPTHSQVFKLDTMLIMLNPTTNNNARILSAENQAVYLDSDICIQRFILFQY